VTRKGLFVFFKLVRPDKPIENMREGGPGKEPSDKEKECDIPADQGCKPEGHTDSNRADLLIYGIPSGYEQGIFRDGDTYSPCIEAKGDTP